MSALPVLGCSEGRGTDSFVPCCYSSASCQIYSLPRLIVTFAGCLLEVAGRKKIGTVYSEEYRREEEKTRNTKWRRALKSGGRKR